MTSITDIELPGLDCGLCGFRSCNDMAEALETKPELLKRCIPLSADSLGVTAAPSTEPSRIKSPVITAAAPKPPAVSAISPQSDVAGKDACGSCGSDGGVSADLVNAMGRTSQDTWQDVLGREFDFILEHFPEEPGPREMVIPHNPMITRELEIEPGEVLVGRPLGISCGCPVTHCGIVQSVDMKTGTMVWCVTGPLHPRQHGFKDIGYYSAQAYEGLISKARIEIEIGKRYWFQPRMCMMQWRHSGLVNFLNRGDDGLQVRIEGLWIG